MGWRAWEDNGACYAGSEALICLGFVLVELRSEECCRNTVEAFGNVFTAGQEDVDFEVLGR